MAQKFETLSTLAGGIAQDFNNVLVGILAHSGLALKALAAPTPAAIATARENVEQVEAAALDAADLAKKLLAFSGKARLAARPLDLASLLHETRRQLRDAVPAGIELELNLTSQLPLVEADAAQIRQLMVHLLTNAADAVGEAGGRIGVGTGIVELEDEEEEGYLPGPLSAGRYIYVTVTDTGRGMDAETLGKIFDPFFTTKSSGQGLGLAAVLGIMHGHSGALKVDSSPGEGTTFQLYFPCSPAKSPVLSPAIPPAAPAPTLATVLVVDDDDTVRKVTQKILETAGYGVRTARDGIEALSQVRDHGAEIALVLLDMRMPRMGGAETFQEMRRMVPALPIIVSSGYDQQEDSATLADQGAVVFLEKPYSPHDLTAKVGLLLDTARR
ncbi:MAG TPA: response regulator [Thermoanaerobaculia bacterium]